MIFTPQGNGTSNRARFYVKFQHGGYQEEVSEVSEKQSEVFEKNKTLSARRRTNHICTCTTNLHQNKERVKP